MWIGGNKSDGVNEYTWEMSLGWMCARYGSKQIRFKGEVGPDCRGPGKPGRVFGLDIIHGQLGTT